MHRNMNYIWDKMRLRVELLRKRPKWPGEDDRFGYQKQYVNFAIRPDERVLDIGSGGYPFPQATVIAEKFLEKSPSRRERLVTHNKPLVVSDISHLAFRDKAFDFVYCSHVLEVVDDPLKACKEIMRVGKRGYIETPTAGKDTLFAWEEDLQKWQVVAIAQNLCFFEYSKRQAGGIRSSAWRDVIFSNWYHPLQESFYANQDLFNVMFTWNGRFSVSVFTLDGLVHTLNADMHRCSASVRPRPRKASTPQLLVWLSELALCGLFDQLFV